MSINIFKAVASSRGTPQTKPCFSLCIRLVQAHQCHGNLNLESGNICRCWKIYSGSTSFTRRSCQTVLAAHLSIVRILSPTLPHLAEDAMQNLPFEYTTEDGCFAEFVFDQH